VPEPEPEVAEPEAPAADAGAAEPEAAAAPDPSAEAEPEAAAAAEPPVVEHYAFPADSPPGEAPSWLEPPRKRRWLRVFGTFLLYVLVLAIVCGAVAAYLLTR